MIQGIVLYDNECSFCVSIKDKLESRDSFSVLKFVPLNSSEGKKHTENIGIGRKDRNSILYISENGSYLARSNAIIQILKKLNYYTILYKILNIIPLFLRDLGYNVIARLRKIL